VLDGLQQTVIDEAISEWHKRLQVCIYTLIFGLFIR